MSVIALNSTVNVTTERCHDCGRWWAIEQHWSGDCPNCAHRNRNKRYHELEAARRTIVALRGALTKAKRRP